MSEEQWTDSLFSKIVLLHEKDISGFQVEKCIADEAYPSIEAWNVCVHPRSGLLDIHFRFLPQLGMLSFPIADTREARHLAYRIQLHHIIRRRQMNSPRGNQHLKNKLFEKQIPIQTISNHVLIKPMIVRADQVYRPSSVLWGRHAFVEPYQPTAMSFSNTMSWFMCRDEHWPFDDFYQCTEYEDFSLITISWQTCNIIVTTKSRWRNIFIDVVYSIDGLEVLSEPWTLDLHSTLAVGIDGFECQHVAEVWAESFLSQIDEMARSLE